LAGVPVPASALESLVLPARVANYSPAMLDELTSSGEVLWAGAGSLAGNDGWLTLVPSEAAAELLDPPTELEITSLHQAILDSLAGGQALFLRGIAERLALPSLDGPSPAGTGAVGSGGISAGTTDFGAASSAPSESDVARAIWDLVFAGHLTNDTLAAVRAR